MMILILSQRENSDYPSMTIYFQNNMLLKVIYLQFTLSRSRSGRQVLYDSLCPGSLSKVQLYIDTDIGEVKELIVIVSKSHHDMGVLSASLWWMGARQ